MWLLVEDDPDIRTVVDLMMKLWGETTLAFPDGNAAWRWLDQVEKGETTEIPELILMDIRMPGHTGDQIAARIRQTEPLKHVPVVLMTAFTLSEGEIDAMKKRAGFDHLIKKPLPDMEDFKSTLYRVRDEKRRQTSLKVS
jgi:two-component system phosphate regulon response regulator PhoB